VAALALSRPLISNYVSLPGHSRKAIFYRFLGGSPAGQRGVALLFANRVAEHMIALSQLRLDRYSNAPVRSGKAGAAVLFVLSFVTVVAAVA